ncbi:hypothetical protein [Streptomyces sp. WMMB 322]|uniref:hypothetical protein n=1 Tax=Streptomyces sp. WMMB 322 TaxID=1286821 RepID=UPI0006E2EF96|nr:hypothetical protein [Streptomyces sp. WMMB 322]SCK24119.1 hypothetical protein H180DRAFT_01819 [Streptomyces sp. WMMB 322]
MTGLSAVLIFVGLFLLGGVIAFWKQKQPKGVIAVLGAGAALALLAGILRLEVWT